MTQFGPGYASPPNPDEDYLEIELTDNPHRSHPMLRVDPGMLLGNGWDEPAMIVKPTKVTSQTTETPKKAEKGVITLKEALDVLKSHVERLMPVMDYDEAEKRYLLQIFFKDDLGARLLGQRVARSPLLVLPLDEAEALTVFNSVAHVMENKIGAEEIAIEQEIQEAQRRIVQLQNRLNVVRVVKDAVQGNTSQIESRLERRQRLLDLT